MKRHVLIYGVTGGALILLLKWSEYHFLVVEDSIEIYAGRVAVIFAAIGIWVGLRLTGRRERVVVREVPVAAPVAAPVVAFEAGERRRERLGITRRELEVLRLMAEGMSKGRPTSNLGDHDRAVFFEEIVTE